MSRAAGTGSPVFFHCTIARRGGDWRDSARYEGHDVTRTGRTRPRRSPAVVGTRSMLTEHEYRCSCGHVGWTNHRDILTRPIDSPNP
jgi:hypothetical protein